MPGEMSMPIAFFADELALFHASDVLPLTIRENANISNPGF